MNCTILFTRNTNVTFRGQHTKKNLPEGRKTKTSKSSANTTLRYTVAYQILFLFYCLITFRRDIELVPETSMSEEWCIEQLAKLQIKERRLTTLNEIKEHLSSVSANEINISTKFLTLLDSIDECRGSSEQMNLTCDILCICMSNLEIDKSSTISYYSYLERCLQHSSVEVKMLGLNDIERRLKSSSTANDFGPNSLVALINCLESDETKVAAAAIRILICLLPKAFDQKPIKHQLEQVLSGKELVRCRVYDIAVKLSQLSQENHTNVEFILEKLVADLDTEDILLQLTVLDLVSDLALSDHGHIYLENKGVFAKVLRHIEQLDDNLHKSLLVPGYLKFFGHIATAQPTKIIEGFSSMINSLFDCILDGNSSVLPVAFDTLGQLARSNEGKILLHELHSNKLNETLNDIGKSIHNLPIPLQTRALNCLETLFQSSDDVSNNLIDMITEIWFFRLTGTNQLTFVQDFCRNPFPEIKIAALGLLRSICCYRWGHRALSETAGFIEYLLDRNIEFDKDAIHEKYNVIKTLADASVFDAGTILQIRQYIKDGAFYVQGVMEVAVESS